MYALNGPAVSKKILWGSGILLLTSCRKVVLGAALRSGSLAADLASFSIPPRKFITVSVNYFEYLRGTARTLTMIIVALGAAPHYKSLAAVALLSAITYVLVLWFLEFAAAEAKILERAILQKPAPPLGSD